MTAIAFSEAGIAVFKRAAKANFPDSKSSHLCEALAVGLGFRTHASLLAALQAADTTDPDYIGFEDEAMVARLRALDPEGVPEDEGDWSELATFDDTKLVRSTRSIKYYEIDYRGDRWMAWRNIMVATINAAIERRLISILPGDNRWPGANIKQSNGRFESHSFDFEVGGIPGVGYVSDAGFDELTIHGAFWPAKDGKYQIRAMGLKNPGFHAGEAVARGWLERRDGAWLQTWASPAISCRVSRLHQAARLQIAARGYADKGNSKM